MSRLGLPLIICAPSGAGKTTLTKKLCAEFPLSFSISCTTRPMREGEIEGKDYFFLSKEEFIQKKEAREFAEWAIVHDYYYGTPLKPLQEKLSHGEDILFDIDVQGALQLSTSLPHAKFVFIFPPSMDELEKRLILRKTDCKEVIQKRMANARKEITESKWFDAWIVNDTIDNAYEALRSFYLSCTLSPVLHSNLVNSILSQKSEG